MVHPQLTQVHIIGTCTAVALFTPQALNLADRHNDQSTRLFHWCRFC